MHSVPWNRINTGLLLIVLVAMIAALATRAYGGPLDPPGTPGPTMKTLQQVEPRTPIVQPASAAGFPIQINAPGSYYFTENITGVFGKDGIVINADNVTLDLSGFTLTTDERILFTVGITDNGIRRTNLIIRNGVVRDWGPGVVTAGSTNSTYEDLTVTDNRGVGMYIGSGSTVRRATVRNNSGTGLYIEQVPDAWGSVVEDSNFSRNGSAGVYLYANNVWMHDNVIDSNGSTGITVPGGFGYNEVTDNRITGNNGFAVVVNGYRNVVVRNVTDGNTSAGQLSNSGAGNIIGPLQQSPSTDPNANIGFS